MKPVAATATVQQRMCNTFMQTYNHARPHEALHDEPPASRWRASPRPFPSRIVPPTYPGHVKVRRASSAGTFRLHNGQQFLRQALYDEMIGVEDVHDGIRNVR